MMIVHLLCQQHTHTRTTLSFYQRSSVWNRVGENGHFLFHLTPSASFAITPRTCSHSVEISAIDANRRSIKRTYCIALPTVNFDTRMNAINVSDGYGETKKKKRDVNAKREIYLPARCRLLFRLSSESDSSQSDNFVPVLLCASSCEREHIARSA